jgi:2-oxoglutarate dehydrogenase E1 component
VQKDTVNETRHVPLNDLAGAQRKLSIYDSPLSEYAVLGYEYGYSTIAKNDLTIWEAQFGDFVNGAQIVIDQFISSAEEKWGQVSNLVMLLPHGYDGQGPEHSSARMERFLQLAAEDNMFVCNFTSPANFFHALRRQVKAPYRKPLIVMTPKGYLRTFVSTINELTDGTFREFIDDASVTNRSRITRVVLCSGKVANELDKRRNDMKAETTAVIRVEQIAPFHLEGLRAILASYPSVTELVWAQEEPKNMGSWFFVNEHLYAAADGRVRVAYVGRPASASPATGSAKKHEAEQDRLLTEAFSPLS